MRLAASWPADLGTIAPIPSVRRRGRDGLLGSGELATRDGLTDVEGQFYPLDIARTIERGSFAASARWVQTIVDRRFRFLHAKALITEKGVLMGSANWTNNSMMNAFELDVLLQIEREIHEMCQLFELLWTSSQTRVQSTTLMRQVIQARANTGPAR